jgi:hypothetical protein
LFALEKSLAEIASCDDRGERMIGRLRHVSITPQILF